MIQHTKPIQKLGISQQKEGQVPLDMTELQHKTVNSLKTSFINWIRSLPMQERFLALKIYSGVIPQLIRKILSRLQIFAIERGSEIPNKNSEFSLKGDAFGDLKKPARKLEKGFYDSLVFISDGQDYLDHICFEYSLLECPDKLFDLITASSDNPNAKLLFEAINFHEPIQLVAQKILSCTTLQEVAQVTLNFLRQEILIRFRESLRYSDFISKNLQEEKRRKRQFSVHLKYLSQDLKKRMILLGFKDIEELKKWFVFNQIKIDFSELQKQAFQLLKLQKNQFSNRIFKCKLKKSLSLIVNYYQQIYFFWKNQVSRIKRRKFSNKITSEKMEKEVSQLSKQEEKEIKNNYNNKRRKMKRKKSVSVESNETNVTWQEKKRAKQKMIHQLEVKGLIQIEKPKESKQMLHYKQKIQSTSCEPPEKKKNRKKRGKEKDQQKQKKLEQCNKDHQKSQVEHFAQKQLVHFTQKWRQHPKKHIPMTHEHLKQFSLEIITEELQAFSDKISEEANVYHDRRIIAFERIQFLMNYYYVNIELFGSCASGIAIRNSDIDIAVKNQILAYFEYLPQHLRLTGAMENLQDIFKSQDYISDINFIGTASIPIIKMKIDTSKICLNPQYGEVYERLNRPHNSGIIEADITIETLNHQSQCNHLGIISTQTINQWLKQIPTLHSIVITLKLLFQTHNLHKTYEGGLNTFSMVVLIVAYIYHAKLEKQTNPGFVLEKILKFYGDQFDQKQFGIDILNYGSGSIFYSKKEREKDECYDPREKADLEVLDPKCKGRNMTRKCYLFPKIKQFLKYMYQKCFEMKFRKIQQLIQTEQKAQIHHKYVEKEKVLKENTFEKMFQYQ